jgi:hypothetical protein
MWLLYLLAGILRMTLGAVVLGDPQGLSSFSPFSPALPLACTACDGGCPMDMDLPARSGHAPRAAAEPIGQPPRSDDPRTLSVAVFVRLAERSNTRSF